MNKINAQKTKDMVIIGLMAAIICVMGRCQLAAVYTGTDFADQSGNLFHFICRTRRTVIRRFDLSFNRNVRCAGIF